MSLYIEWEGCVRLNDGDEDCGPRIRIYYTAKGFHPETKDTMWEPARRAFFDTIKASYVAIDPRDKHMEPLTLAEVNAALDWFESDDAQEYAEDVAVKEWLTDYR